MATMVQARLDDETKATLDLLVHQHGMRKSDILRQGIRLVKLERERQSAKNPQKLIGVGEFDSGIKDLSSNPKSMEGFGKKWRNGKWDW